MKYINRIPELQNAITTAKNSTHPNPPWPKPQTNNGPKKINKTTQQAIDIYLQNTNADGTINGTSWWQTANGYTAIALHDLWSGSGEGANYDNLSTLLRQCEESNRPRLSFINDWNDDSCWWALCCVHMYAIGQDPWFLERAKDVWRHVSSSVCGKGQEFFEGMDMEGAVFWKTAPPGADHINAISTGLYAELSVRLALIEQQQSRSSDGGDSNPSAEEYLDAALKSLRWILRCRYLPEEALVLDHIELKEQKAIDWIFTYNTGVVLGICALLYEATWEDEWMVLACHMVSRIWSRRIWIEEDGVLTEAGAYGRGKNDPMKNSDAVGFKSVLVRQLCTLRDIVFRTGCSLFVAFKTAVEIGEFVKINFDSQVERNTDGKGHYGPWWNGPFECPTSHSQMAVLDVMAAMMLANRHWMHGGNPG